MINLEFPALAKNKFGISVVEYVNQFFKDKAEDTTYLNQLLKVCKDNSIEYEGSNLSEDEGVRKTKTLLEKYLR
jgi:formyltetrahydrofolate synthetase